MVSTQVSGFRGWYGGGEGNKGGGKDLLTKKSGIWLWKWRILLDFYEASQDANLPNELNKTTYSPLYVHKTSPRGIVAADPIFF